MPRIRLIKNHANIPEHDGSESQTYGIGKLHVLHLGKDTGSNQREGCRDGNAESFRKHPEEEKNVTMVNQILDESRASVR